MVGSWSPTLLEHVLRCHKQAQDVDRRAVRERSEFSSGYMTIALFLCRKQTSEDAVALGFTLRKRLCSYLALPSFTVSTGFLAMCWNDHRCERPAFRIDRFPAGSIHAACAGTYAQTESCTMTEFGVQNTTAFLISPHPTRRNLASCITHYHCHVRHMLHPLVYNTGSLHA